MGICHKKKVRGVVYEEVSANAFRRTKLHTNGRNIHFIQVILLKWYKLIRKPNTRLGFPQEVEYIIGKLCNKVFIYLTGIVERFLINTVWYMYSINTC